MIITSIATFTIRAGQERGALRLIRAVERQAKRDQPGTLVYLAHLVLDTTGKPTRRLYFYERYASKSALDAHLASTSWEAVTAQWSTYFEGRSGAAIKFFGVKRIAAFARKGAIPRG